MKKLFSAALVVVLVFSGFLTAAEMSLCTGECTDITVAAGESLVLTEYTTACSVTVGGSLTLQGMMLCMKQGTATPKIWVQAGGSMTVTASTVKGETNYFWNVDDGASFTMQQDSTVSQCGKDSLEDYETGLYVQADLTQISGTTFQNNYRGLILANSQDSEITGNTFSNNQWQGIYLKQSTSNQISSNEFTGNELGIFLRDSDENALSGNLVPGTENEAGIRFWNSKTNVLTNNDLSGFAAASRSLTLVEGSTGNTLSGGKLSGELHLNASGNNLDGVDLIGLQTDFVVYHGYDNQTLKDLVLPEGKKLVVQSDNTIVDGVTINNPTGTGLFLSGASNSEFKNLNVKAKVLIHFKEAEGNTVTGGVWEYTGSYDPKWGDRASQQQTLTLMNEKKASFKPACEDSDGGFKVYVKGTARDEYFVLTDTCSGAKLSEAFCDGVYARAYPIDCANGCLNGACRKQASYPLNPSSWGTQPGSSTQPTNGGLIGYIPPGGGMIPSPDEPGIKFESSHLNTLTAKDFTALTATLAVFVDANSFGNKVSGNQFNKAFISVQGVANEVTGNTFSGESGVDLVGAGNAVQANTLSKSRGVAVWGESSEVQGNSLTAAGLLEEEPGVAVHSKENVVTGNTVTGGGIAVLLKSFATCPGEMSAAACNADYNYLHGNTITGAGTGAKIDAGNYNVLDGFNAGDATDEVYVTGDSKNYLLSSSAQVSFGDALSRIARQWRVSVEVKDEVTLEPIPDATVMISNSLGDTQEFLGGAGGAEEAGLFKANVTQEVFGEGGGASPAGSNTLWFAETWDSGTRNPQQVQANAPGYDSGGLDNQEIENDVKLPTILLKGIAGPTVSGPPPGESPTIPPGPGYGTFLSIEVPSSVLTQQTRVLVHLSFEGTPTCDNAMKLTAVMEDSITEYGVKSCSQGRHVFWVDTSVPGRYTVTAVSSSYGQASKQFTAIGRAPTAVPEIAIVLVVLVGLTALYLRRRK